jgi:uncharacterized protein
MANPGGKSIKVLSIDGGGIRGIIAAVILRELLQSVGRPAHETFDLIAGTSTGGILALGLGTPSHNGEPYTPQELLDLYLGNGQAIFHKDLLTVPRQVCFPKYSAGGLESVLAKYFGATMLRSALAPLLVSSYDLQGQIPYFFKSHKIHRSTAYDWKVAEVARATSAAPTYFPPLHLANSTEDLALVDGGVYVNNPAVAAYVEARALYPAASQFVVIAVGTGNRQDHIRYQEVRDWGLAFWATKIIPVFMDSVSEAVDYELDQLLGPHQFRFQPIDLGKASNQMDDVEPRNLSALQDVGEEYLASNRRRLTDAVNCLRDGRGDNMPGIGR